MRAVQTANHPKSPPFCQIPFHLTLEYVRVGLEVKRKMSLISSNVTLHLGNT